MIRCTNCDDGYWVCENHADKPWEGTSNSEDACDCGGAGMPCPTCNTGSTPKVDWKEVICSTDKRDMP